MIRVNLLGEKEDHTVRNFVHTTTYIASVAVTVIGCVIVNAGIDEQLDARTREKAQLTSRLAELETVTKQIEDLEKNKKTLKEKLQTIATLKAKKHGPVRILDSVNEALPERAWLLAVKEKGGALDVQGIALDNQTISNFMSNLERYPYFQNVELGLSTKYEKDGIELKQFSLTVGLRSALDVQKQANGAQGAAGATGSAPEEQKEKPAGA